LANFVNDENKGFTRTAASPKVERTLDDLADGD